MTDNVVSLNAFKENKDESSHVEMSKSDIIIDIAIEITHDIVEQLREAGYSFEDTPDVAYDLIMLTEAIKSLLHTSEGEYYPLHKIAEGLFDEEEAEEFLSEFVY